MVGSCYYTHQQTLGVIIRDDVVCCKQQVSFKSSPTRMTKHRPGVVPWVTRCRAERRVFLSAWEAGRKRWAKFFMPNCFVVTVKRINE